MKKEIAITQALILLVATFAFAFALTLPKVSALDTPITRITPAGESENPYQKKLAQELSALSDKEKAQIYDNMEEIDNKNLIYKFNYGWQDLLTLPFVPPKFLIDKLNNWLKITANRNLKRIFEHGAIPILVAFSYKTHSREVFSYQIGLWQPPKGGNHCEDCNSLKYGCSEYQCHTFGTACTLINVDTEEQRCVWENPNDFDAPIITFNKNSLPNSDYSFSYTYDNGIISGAQIKYKGGKLPAFKGITFGITVDKPALCSYGLDYDYGQTIEELPWVAKPTSYVENHSVTISNTNFPSEYAIEEVGATIDANAKFEYFFMCESINGVKAQRAFIVSFNVEDGPDTTPPLITGTNPIEESYIKAGLTQFPLELYTDEPANCSWSFQDKPYEQMEYKMTDCSQNYTDYTFPPYGFGCKSTLTGIKKGENKYYIRCIDKPQLNLSDEDAVLRSGGNRANDNSYVLTLIGTDPLVIDEILINNKIGYSTDEEPEEINFKNSTAPIPINLHVSTSQGAEENGNAICRYRRMGTSQAFDFKNDGSFDYVNPNTDTLYLGSGTQSYDITCCDKAENCDSEQISFNIELDQTPPEISRVYSEGNQLKVITTEEGKCVYSLSTCNYLFEDGTPFSTSDGFTHVTNWDTESDLHVKCMDNYGNDPTDPKDCQIVVRASDLYE